MRFEARDHAVTTETVVVTTLLGAEGRGRNAAWPDRHQRPPSDTPSCVLLRPTNSDPRRLHDDHARRDVLQVDCHHPALRPCGIKHIRVRASRQPLIAHGVNVMAGRRKLDGEMIREILVQLDLHAGSGSTS